jgi:CheY-like chemotaxis protein
MTFSAEMRTTLIRADQKAQCDQYRVGRPQEQAARETAMRRILVVDDDPHIGLAIRAWLRRYGFRVSMADGGSNGLAALQSSTFDLMLVDIFMPGMRGFESIRMFHDRAPTVPLIAISGYAFSGPEASGPELLRMAAGLGATRCLRKPFRPATLLAVIDACLSEADQRYVATLAAGANALPKPQLRSPDKLRGKAVAG